MEGAKARVAGEVVAEFMVPAHSLFAPDNGKLDLKQIGCSDRTPKTPKENRNAMRAKAADARTCVDASSDYVFC